MAVKESSAIVQVMAMIEEFTPIKPVTGKGNTFEDAMYYAGLFGLKQEQIFLLVGLGLLYAAQPVGAAVAAALVSTRPTIHRQGATVLWSIAIYGASVALFGVSPWLP